MGLKLLTRPVFIRECGSITTKLPIDQINNSAILIFVIINEGFDRIIGEHFRNLAITQKRADNMVLVVNKIGRTSIGNTKEQQTVIAGDLMKVITSYKSNDL